MVDASSRNIDVEKLLSYCDDLAGVLRDKRDFNNLSQVLEHSTVIQSSSIADFNDVQSSIRDYQKKIDDCMQKTEGTKSNVVADEELERLQKVHDEKLQRVRFLQEELRVVEEKINDLDEQRLSIEERNQSLKKLQQDDEKAQTKLSFYASVTNIIPDLGSQSKISGQIVQRDKQVVERFDIDPEKVDSYDMCNSIWKMINH
ncbi:hypothetical protein Ancab_015279 [Ancistrocladus abbreviatus]